MMIVIVLWPASSAPVMVCYLQGMKGISEAMDLGISEILQYSMYLSAAFASFLAGQVCQVAIAKWYLI